MKLRQQLIIGSLLAPVMVFITGLFFLVQINKIADPLHNRIPEIVDEIANEVYIGNLAELTRYYDEVLTQSARNYAFTGKKKWLERYQAFEPKLDSVIKAAIQKSDKHIQKVFDKLDAVNQSLVAMEEVSLELASQGRLGEATKVLESKEYTQQKENYYRIVDEYVVLTDKDYKESLARSFKSLNSLTNEYNKFFKGNQQFAFIVMILATGLSVLIAIAFAYLIVRPLRSLIWGLGQAALGNLGYRLDIERKDEIGDLARVFNGVMKALKESMTSVKNLNREIAARKKFEDKVYSLAKFPSENPNPIFRLGRQGEIIYKNNAVDELVKQTGLSVNEIISDEVIELAKRSLEDNTHFKGVEAKIADKVFSYTISPVLDGGYVNLYAVDITKKSLAESRAAMAISEWQRTFDAISDLVFIQDTNFTILKANRSLLEALSLKSEEVVGKKCYEVMHDRDRPWLTCPFEKTAMDHQAHTELVDDPKLGRPFLVTTSPIIDETGRLSGSIHIAKDMSDRIKTEKVIEETRKQLEKKALGLEKANKAIREIYEEMEQKNIELRRLDRLKSEFISTVSHELRTPLSITKEGISLILDKIPGEINQKQQDILNTSKNNIDRLSRIINDLLDISKIESGKAVVERKLVDIREVINELVSFFKPKLAKKKIIFKLKLPKKALKVYIDPDKIKQAFLNLIDNAIKFTDKGFVELEIEEKPGHVLCSVVDTGKGIEAKDIPKVFDKFEQFGRLVGAGEKGTGLGLSIVKGIVDMHNGKIWVESTKDKGTKFSILLPRYKKEFLFKEVIRDRLREAEKNNTHFSLLLLSLVNFEKEAKKILSKQVDDFQEKINAVIRITLKLEGDLITRPEFGDFIVLLDNCRKEKILRIEKRIKTALIDYLKQNDKSRFFKFKLGGAIYPDQARDVDELIMVARSEQINIDEAA